MRVDCLLEIFECCMRVDCFLEMFESLYAC